MGAGARDPLLGGGAPPPRWLLPPPVELPPGYAAALGLALPATELLYRRGLRTAADALAYLGGELPGPAAPDLPDLDVAVARVLGALAAGERICVYGDYDADGVTSTALLVRLLGELGAHPAYHVPNRFREGYGLNARVLEELAAAGVRLVLTCDNGVSAAAEVARAAALGMAVVVTDHHELPPRLPDCPVVNPRRLPADHPAHWLSGSGTAWLFGRALLQAAGRDPAGADRYLELAAIGMIADVVPLTGWGRSLCRRGLARLWQTPLPGLRSLLRVAGLSDGDEEDVAFQIAPRLNAAGRMADAGLAVRLLLTDDATEGGGLAAELDRLNARRRELGEHMRQEALADAAGPLAAGAPALVLYRPGWHEGILGIVAGQLCEQTGRPVAMLARRSGSGIVVGSARAPAGFPLYDAVAGCAAVLERFGGHAAAAGFSLQEAHVPEFQERLAAQAAELAPPPDPDPVAVADLALPLAAADRDLYTDLRRLAPWGPGSPAPVFLAGGVQVLSARPTADRRHLRLILRQGGAALGAVWWRGGDQDIPPGPVEVAYRLDLNRWQGAEVLQLVIAGLQPAGTAAPAAELPGLAAETPVAEPGLVAETPAAYIVARAPTLVDRRGEPLAAVLAEFPGAQVFAEGPAPPGTADRYRLAQSAALILLTPPPGPKVLEEVLALAGSATAVLAWARTPPLDAPGPGAFPRHLLGLLRHALERRGGRITLAELAARTGELEAAVLAGLRALAYAGLVVLYPLPGDAYVVEQGAAAGRLRPGPATDHLRRLLRESSAFRAFLAREPLDRIKAALESAIVT